MSTEEEIFADAFKKTSDAIAEGQTGSGAVPPTEPPATPPATPPAGETTPPAAATPPAGETTPPAGETKPPAGETTPPAGETTPPAGETKPPAGETTPPAGGTTPPAGETTPPAVVTPPAATPPAPSAKESEQAAEIVRLTAELAAKAGAAPAPKAGETTPPAVPPGGEAPPAGETAPVVKPYEFNADQKKVIEEFEKEWPDVAAAMKLQSQAQVHEVMQGMKNLVDDLYKRIDAGLAPVVNTHIQSEEQKHFTAIRAAHTDYDAVIDLVPDWIKKQPEYLKVPLTQVYEKGDAASVIDLLSRMKKETGHVQPQTPNPDPKAIATPPAATPPAAEKVAALTVVPTKGGGKVNTEPPPAEDFATAFNKTVAELNKAIAVST